MIIGKIKKEPMDWKAALYMGQLPKWMSCMVEKARELQKNIYFCFIDYTKAFDCVDHNKLWKVLKRDGNTRLPDLPLEKPIRRSGSNS